MQEECLFILKLSTSIATKLCEKMAAEGWTQSALSVATGIDQSQISRIRAGRFARLSKNVQVLCKYANIAIQERSADPDIPHVIRDALNKLLDGTPATERAVVALLRAAAKLDHQGPNK